MSVLTDALDGWAPGPVTDTDALRAWPVAAFSGMLDLPGTVADDGDPIPPLWHWFAFLEHPAQAELGADGHPTDGHFLPPIPDRRRMFAGGRLRIDEPVRVGEQVRRDTALDGVRIKSGRSGEMAFVTLRQEFHRVADDRLLMVEEQDFVYRSQPAGTGRGMSAPEPVDPPSHEHALTIATGPELLFRFSALTYNAHRIHYDHPYATGVEGYPGLVVHGPLLAMTALEIPRRHAAGQRVTSFEYRLTSPAFAGADLWAGGSAVTGEGSGAPGMEIECGSVGGPASVRGRVELG
ncbi:MaoC family dehydratase N-terminal domain-containing protein [Pseudonocardia sp. KRD291]|uniref:FAS1-like dehydratase domain-containing protein n=1 Tax=Pseudonocardia sp. KRD291 TaxID=2792007 RepID=UPI001C5C51FC|nr:MaoC family dehydratase N-terminal domain-containing protein [Pseudonocardia sp. KRD291]MBW0104451.1 MaoC family dehydratase N-terminal domain-containing protein [Pseudonocardia sp. KRD291]